MAGLYLIYALLASLLVPTFIYPFDQTLFQAQGFRRVEVADTPPLYVHDAGPDAPVVIYFMGNIGSLQWFGPDLQMHGAAGRSIVAMTYRGGGGESGQPSESALKSDALATFDALEAVLPDHGPVILHGYSLGSGLAFHVAARREADAVLVVAPYARLCEVMAQKSWVPACRVPWVDRWQSLPDARATDEPILILHGTADELIPITQSERLAGDSQVGPVEFRRLNATHTDIVVNDAYASEVGDLIAGALGN
ncbi:alpha/beta hydrolase [Pelagovum pacificum]|uniref:alpha/beta hydrolase n=1 Tax=Pelagovum pacificum TaxID=2588711 RepID=UPI0018CD24A5|nr:alpha/beta hydrolase [Pelagovum pacificum]QQA44499.1 alpha/beta hydrolase [Pelagovum pacificum]